MNIEPQDSSILVLADIAKLERVLSNLVDNAVRHCSGGDQVSVKFRPEGAAHIRIDVTDTGTGIDEDDLPHIFTPHFRGKNRGAGNKINSGLGLAITKRLLELHKTEISVTSRPGEGTCFSFCLPVGHYQ